MKILVMIAALLVAVGASGAERIITLTDGSTIKGNVVSLQNDTFVVKTLLGTLDIKASQIVSMSRPGNRKKKAAPTITRDATKRDTAAAGRRAIASIQKGIAGNTSLMRDLLQLQNDPQMKAVLSDPTLMKEVKDLDLSKLAKDPRIQALMNNPAVRDIQSGVH